MAAPTGLRKTNPFVATRRSNDLQRFFTRDRIGALVLQRRFLLTAVSFLCGLSVSCETTHTRMTTAVVRPGVC